MPVTVRQRLRAALISSPRWRLVALISTITMLFVGSSAEDLYCRTCGNVTPTDGSKICPFCAGELSDIPKLKWDTPKLDDQATEDLWCRACGNITPTDGSKICPFCAGELSDIPKLKWDTPKLDDQATEDLWCRACGNI